MSENTNLTTTQEGQTPAVEETSMAERFTAKVLTEFGSSVAGAVEVTDFQRRLIQGYFIMIDRALKMAEENRQNKNKNNKDHKYDENLPVIWRNVNINDLALDLVRYARIGLDMQQENMLSPVPYKNNKLNCYDITLMPGYNGIKYTAKKYAMEPPKSETVELVYKTDTFTPHPKDSQHPAASYEFEINNAFDRGDVIGGFGFFEYDDPTKNQLILMPLKDILKRKPSHASANFWGGKQMVWENGKKVEKDAEGWFEEMCKKTLVRECYSAKHLPRDPEKVDENYQYLKVREAHYAELQAEAEIVEQANIIPIDTTPTKTLPEPKKAATITVDTSTGEVVGATQTAQQAPEQAPRQAPIQDVMDGPTF